MLIDFFKPYFNNLHQTSTERSGILIIFLGKRAKFVVASDLCLTSSKMSACMHFTHTFQRFFGRTFTTHLFLCFPSLIESKTEKYLGPIVSYISFLQLLPDVGFSCLDTISALQCSERIRTYLKIHVIKSCFEVKQITYIHANVSMQYIQWQ